MLIVGNWKAYVQSEDEARELLVSAKKLSRKPGTEIILAMPSPYIGIFSPKNSSKVAIAAQDLSQNVGGAATGEITAPMLADLGVKYAIIGHSERRARGDTDAIVSKKVRNAFASRITPIVCIGEANRDIDAKYLGLLRAQIHAVFEPLAPKERQKVILAYEPIWAIGKSASEALLPTDLTEMVLYIRKVLGDYLPGRSALGVTILYGGSVEPGNIVALAADTGIDGFLPGHASADVATFSELVKAVS